MVKNTLLILLVLLALGIISCRKDIGKLPAFCDINGKFNPEIQTIIASKCAVSGCHVSGSPFGNFSNYDGIKTEVNKGTFENNVFIYKIMPPSVKEQLTAEELQKIKCWFDNGAPND
jgi:hypothetical protein